MKNIVIIDGRGGGIGKSLVQQIKALLPNQPLLACGTSEAASWAMQKAGADYAAWGDDALQALVFDADLIVGPIGIVMAGAMGGEITARMARTIAASSASKILLPVNRCQTYIVGTGDKKLSEYIAEAVELTVKKALEDE